MNEQVEKLLKPVSPEQPCGPDLSNDPRFDELQTILKGKPEVEIGSVVKPAEPPDWRELQSKSAELFSQTKHLRIAMMLCCSWLRTGGVAGLRDGLQLIRGLLEQYWAGIYPLLDPEDNNDPTQRLNIVRALTEPRGSMGAGWLATLDYLYAATLCQAAGMPPVTFDQLQAAKQKAAGVEGAPADAPDFAKLATAIRSATDQIVVRHQELKDALEALQGIDQFLTTTLGAGNTISFDVLEKALKEIIAGLDPYLPGAVVSADNAGGIPGEAAAAGTSSGVFVSGPIRSPNDVVRSIDSICEYYRQVEPSSPVPYLLRRAQKMVSMNFVEAVQELNLATVESLRPSMGSAVDSAAPPAETAPAQ